MKNFLVGLLGGVCGGLILMYLSSMGMVNTANKLDEQHIVMENDLTKNDEGFTTQQVDKVLDEGGDTGGGNGGGNGGGDTGGGNGGGDTGGDTGDGEEEATPRGPTGIECPNETTFKAVNKDTPIKEEIIGGGNGVFNPLLGSLISHKCKLSDSMDKYNQGKNSDYQFKDLGLHVYIEKAYGTNVSIWTPVAYNPFYYFETALYACRYSAYIGKNKDGRNMYEKVHCPIKVETRPHGCTAIITKNGTNGVKYEGTFDGAYAFSKIRCDLFQGEYINGAYRWRNYKNGGEFKGTQKGVGIKHFYDKDDWKGLPARPRFSVFSFKYAVKCFMDNGAGFQESSPLCVSKEIKL